MLGVHDEIGNKAFGSFSKAFNKKAVIDIGAASLVHNVREKSVYFSCAFLEKSVNLR